MIYLDCENFFHHVFIVGNVKPRNLCIFGLTIIVLYERGFIFLSVWMQSGIIRDHLLLVNRTRILIIFVLIKCND